MTPTQARSANQYAARLRRLAADLLAEADAVQARDRSSDQRIAELLGLELRARGYTELPPLNGRNPATEATGGKRENAEARQRVLSRG
ncbi:MAG: hypothetical protein AAF328_00375 [Planctomycetota bacterium]